MTIRFRIQTDYPNYPRFIVRYLKVRETFRAEFQEFQTDKWVTTRIIGTDSFPEAMQKALQSATDFHAKRESSDKFPGLTQPRTLTIP